MTNMILFAASRSGFALWMNCEQNRSLGGSCPSRNMARQGHNAILVRVIDLLRRMEGMGV